MALSLLGFNPGIEVMQLFVIVIALALPWRRRLARTPAYGWVRVGGAALAAAGWVAERVSGQPDGLGQAAGRAAAYAPYGLGLLAGLALLLTWRQRSGRPVPSA